MSDKELLSRQLLSERMFAKSFFWVIVGYLCFVGAVGLVVMAILGFWLSVKNQPDMVSFYFKIPFPLLLALGLIVAGVRHLRNPFRVRVSEAGLEVWDYRSNIRYWTWDQIAFSEIKGFQLVVYEVNAKALVKLSFGFTGFDEMVKVIQQQIVLHGSLPGSMAQRRKICRTGIGLVAIGIFIIIMAVVSGWLDYQGRTSRQLLAEKGVSARATVIEKVIAPDGRTKRLRYRVTDSNGASDIANVQVMPWLWDITQINEQIEVVAVPGRPDLSRLVIGQVKDELEVINGRPELTSKFMWLVYGVTAFFGVAAVVMGILKWRGIDIVMVPKRGLCVRRVK